MVRVSADRAQESMQAREALSTACLQLPQFPGAAVVVRSGVLLRLFGIDVRDRATERDRLRLELLARSYGTVATQIPDEVAALSGAQIGLLG